MLRSIIFACLIFLFSVTAATAETQLWQPPTLRILFAGNSITRHRPLRMHQGDWGMAASAESKDYVHQTVRLYAERTGAQADFRLAQMDVTWDHALPAYEQAITEFEPDVVILQIGDNATYDEDVYKASLRQIIGAAGNRRIILTGVWYNATKESWSAEVAQEYVNVLFVPIFDLDTAVNVADASCVATDPICGHPGDAGMLAIAERILEALPDHWLFFPQVGG